MKTATRAEMVFWLTGGPKKLLTHKQADQALQSLEENVMAAVEIGFDRIILGRGLVLRVTWSKPVRRKVGFGEHSRVITVPGSYKLSVAPTKRLKVSLAKRQLV